MIILIQGNMMMMMMMMMMNCFRGMVDWQKEFSLISSQDHRQRSSPSQISDMLQAGFEPAQNLSLGFVEWRCVVVITTTQWHHMNKHFLLLCFFFNEYELHYELLGKKEKQSFEKYLYTKLCQLCIYLILE